MSGTINISRDLWDDDAFRDEPFTQREAWVWMVAEASWRARYKPVGIYKVWTERGQLAVSTRFLARAWKWSDSRVRRYLDMLENRRMIARVTDAHATIITICKYDIYQSKASVDDAQSTHQPTHRRRTGDANENKGVIRDIGSGDGSAREPEPTDPIPETATEREQLLEAMGCDPSGLIGPNGRMIGRMSDMQMVQRWRDELGLTFSEIIGQVREVMAGKADTGPPSTFRYFEQAMCRFAGEKAGGPKLVPITGEPGNERKNARNQGGSAKRANANADATTRAIAFAGAARRAPSEDSF